MVEKGRNRAKVTRMIDWQNADPEDVVGHRFIAKADEDETLDGFLHKSKKQSDMNLGYGDYLYSLHSAIRVFDIRYDYVFKDNASFARLALCLKKPFISIIVLEETE